MQICDPARLSARFFWLMSLDIDDFVERSGEEGRTKSLMKFITDRSFVNPAAAASSASYVELAKAKCIGVNQY